MASQPVRQPAVAGLFYPADPRALAGQIQTLLAQVPLPEELVPPKALIVPHAGYMYSGSTAAAAFGLLEPLRESVRRVVLIGPSHRFAFQGVALPRSFAFATPLGSLEVDSAALFDLAQLADVVVDDRAHAQEHSLEVLLPFLQIALEDIRIVPMVVGDLGAERLSEILNHVWGGPETLIVVSSDLSHYQAYAEAQHSDSHTADEILALQPVLHHGQACGATGINALIRSARQHQCSPQLLALRNSGDTAGDRNRVVGYAAISFTADAHVSH